MTRSLRNFHRSPGSFRALPEFFLQSWRPFFEGKVMLVLCRNFPCAAQQLLVVGQTRPSQVAWLRRCRNRDRLMLRLSWLSIHGSLRSKGVPFEFPACAKSVRLPTRGHTQPETGSVREICRFLRCACRCSQCGGHAFRFQIAGRLPLTPARIRKMTFEPRWNAVRQHEGPPHEGQPVAYGKQGQGQTQRF